MATRQRQSIVVLAGWLGCRPKALQRYEQLYQRMLMPGEGGVDRAAAATTTTLPPSVIVLPRIAPPYQIVQTCLGQPVTMDDMARQLIHDVRELLINAAAAEETAGTAITSELYFHAFSNAGCILWDRFRHQLMLSQSSEQEKDRANDNQLVLNSIRGVIFDSGPIAKLSLIQPALRHCTWQERTVVVRECGGLDYLRPERLRPFGEQFQKALRTDPWPIPQLYLYSRDDPLTPHEFIEDLIDARRRLYQQQQQQQQSSSTPTTITIHSHCWDKSAHCAHFVHHPETYERVVAEFLEQTRRSTTTMTNASPRSKL
jgi:pimeloyl-ACP methyl ester carboxylesterase